MKLNTRKLEQFINELDFALTDKNKEGYLSVFDFEEFWWGQEYYLSDGGYSRIRYSPEHEITFLTSNSLKKPKERWNTPEAKTLREKIEIEVKNLYCKMATEDETTTSPYSSHNTFQSSPERL
jgi:uncharacterized protein (DUF1919 family)